jgi:hypothetical protein
MSIIIKNNCLECLFCGDSETKFIKRTKIKPHYKFNIYSEASFFSNYCKVFIVKKEKDIFLYLALLNDINVILLTK